MKKTTALFATAAVLVAGFMAIPVAQPQAQPLQTTFYLPQSYIVPPASAVSMGLEYEWRDFDGAAARGVQYGDHAVSVI